MTIAEERMLELLKRFIKNYDDNEESMYSEIEDARKLVEVLEPRK